MHNSVLLQTTPNRAEQAVVPVCVVGRSALRAPVALCAISVYIRSEEPTSSPVCTFECIDCHSIIVNLPLCLNPFVIAGLICNSNRTREQQSCRVRVERRVLRAVQQHRPPSSRMGLFQVSGRHEDPIHTMTICR
jgi:hypothetical protein